jgi:hypothetical protein
MGCDWHKIYNDTWNRHKEAQAIGMDHNAPEFREIVPIKLIGTPFMGCSNKKQRELFFISKAYIEKLYTDWLTVKNNCDIRMKFSPCKECTGKNLHIITQGLRECLEKTIKEDWKQLDKVAKDFVDLYERNIVDVADVTVTEKRFSKRKCYHCVFQSYSKLLKKLFNDFKLTLEES